MTVVLGDLAVCASSPTCQHPILENERISMRLVHDDIRRSSVKQPTSAEPTAPEPDKEALTTEAATAKTPSADLKTSEAAGQPAPGEPPSGTVTGNPQNDAGPSQGEKSRKNSTGQETTNKQDSPR